MIKKIFLIILLTYSISAASGQNEIEISRCSVSEISSSNFLLNYSIKNTFSPESFSTLKLTLPLEKYIIQGSIENGFINEKDFLFSQLNINLNGDNDLLDSFKAKISSGRLLIENKKISLLAKSTSKYNVLVPLDEAGNVNINRITKTGKSFTIRNFSSDPPEITIGLNPDDDIEFKKFSNSQLLIEIILPDKNAGESLLINKQKCFSGITNEKQLTGGENLYRFFTLTNIVTNNNRAEGKIQIENILKPFELRITYYFSISENLILMNQKIIKVK